MSDYCVSHSVSIISVSSAHGIFLSLRLSLPDDASESDRKKQIVSNLKSLGGESFSRGCSELVVHPKLETHLVVILPETTDNDGDGGVSYHQHCYLVKAEHPLTKSEVLNNLDLLGVNEVSCSWEHMEHSESGVYYPGDVLYGFYKQAEQEDQEVPTVYDHDSAVTDRHTHEFTSQAMPLPSPHSSSGSNNDAVVPSPTSDDRKVDVPFDPHSLQPQSFGKLTQEHKITQNHLCVQESSQSPILHCRSIKIPMSSPLVAAPTVPSYNTPNPLPQPTTTFSDKNDEQLPREFVHPTAATTTHDVCNAGAHALVVGQGRNDANADQHMLSDKMTCSCNRTKGVHYIEAACGLPLICEMKVPLNQSIVDSVTKSISAIRKGRTPNNSEELKGFIREHCDTGCSDPGCKIPHLYAGCPMPIPESDPEPWITSPRPANHSKHAGSCVTTRQVIERRPVDRVSESEEHQAQFAIDTRRPMYNPPLQDTAASDGGAEVEEEPVFPKTTSDIKRGKFIYKRKDVCSILPSDHFGFVPDPNSKHSHVLGKGANGCVIKHDVGTYHLALKLTTYRAGELNIWGALRHPNIVPLLAVVAYERRCLQVMTQMTGTLKDEFRGTGYSRLLDLFNISPECMQALIMDNVRYVIREILEALKYLQERNIMHGDIKMTNILVFRDYDCPSVFLFQCSHNKPSIQLGDFDSAKKIKTASPESYHYYDNYPVTRKVPEECARVLGTPGCRSPEQFLRTAPVIASHHRNIDFDGPWCDIRALGVMVTTLFMGNNYEKHNKKAWTVMGQPYRQDMDKSDPTFEAICTLLKEMEMHNEYTCNPHVKSAAEFVSRCVEVDFRDRPSATELLKSDVMYLL